MMPKTRLEAFSDGVIAIIITIMVLELPRPEGHDWHMLTKLWPTLLGYTLSFIYVGIYWNNHHHMLHAVKAVSGASLWANLHLLFWLSLFPYVTGWAGESHFAPVPMTCYAFVALMCAVAFMVLSILLQRANPQNHLLDEAVGTGNKEKFSMVAYVLATLTPLLSNAEHGPHWGVWVSGLLLLGVALVWLIPDRRIERVMSQATEQ